MSRKSNPFDEIFKTIKDRTDNINGTGFDFGSLLNNPNVQNLLNSETLMNFASQATSQVFNSKVLSDMLDANPNISDELITDRINSFKNDHPQSNDIIDKYLQSYKEKHSNKEIYNIRKFVKSDDCKKALDDPQVKQYLKDILAPYIKEKMSKAIKK